MTDIVVYNQKDLDRALSDQCPVIVLCAGFFIIPKSPNTIFKRIGPVHAVVKCSRSTSKKLNMTFINIYPEFNADYAVSTIEGREPVSVTFSSGSGSYLYGSSSGSYLYGSGGSYRYTYEYEFEFRKSFSRSFTSSFKTSFVGSFSSYLATSYVMHGSFNEYLSDNAIDIVSVPVFGYGINLI